MATVTTIQAALNSRWANRLLPWFGAAVLAAGTVVFLVKVFGTSDEPAPVAAPPAERQVQLPDRRQPPRAPLDRRARVVAGKFILTAVARRNLAESWNLMHPSLRAGYTKRQWVTSEELPIVPVP